MTGSTCALMWRTRFCKSLIIRLAILVGLELKVSVPLSGGLVSLPATLLSPVARVDVVCSTGEFSVAVSLNLKDAGTLLGVAIPSNEAGWIEVGRKRR